MDQEEKKNQKKQTRKQRPDNIKVQSTKERKEEEKLKQLSLKEFMQIAKTTIVSKEKDEMEDKDYNPPRSNKDKSREASIFEVFTGFCHMEEIFDQMLNANDEKWKILKRVDTNRINALTRLIKSQDKRIRVLETAHKNTKKAILMKLWKSIVKYTVMKIISNQIKLLAN